MAIHDDPHFGFKLLIHLIRCPSVINKALDKLKPDDFDRAGEMSRRIIWAVIKDWYVIERRAIPRDILEIEVRTRLRAAPGILSKSEEESMWSDILAAYLYPTDELQPDWILRNLSEFLIDRQVMPQIQLAASMGSGEELTGLLEKINKVKAQSQLRTVNEETIFRSSTKVTVNIKRKPTGVLYVDKMLNGGTIPGELYGVLAPSGGGKTTTGIAVVVEGARSMRHTAFFSYETEVQPEISNRMYMVAGKIPRDAFKDLTSMDDLASSHRIKLDTALDTISPYMHICDMKKELMKGIGSGGPAELRTKLEEYKDAGTPIELVVIDQLLSMLAPYMAVNGMDVENKRSAIVQLIEQLRDTAQAMKCCIFILHQADNMAKRKSPMTKPTGGQAAEDKSFENNMHFAMQFGTQDQLGRSWLASTKHRYSAPEAIIVQQSPEYWEILYEEGRWEATSEGFAESSKVASYDTPTAARVDSSPVDV